MRGRVLRNRVRLAGAVVALLVGVLLVAAVLSGLVTAEGGLLLAVLLAVAGLQAWVLRRTTTVFRAVSRSREELSRSREENRLAAAHQAKHLDTVLARVAELTVPVPCEHDAVLEAVAALHLSLESTAGAMHANQGLFATDLTESLTRTERAVADASTRHSVSAVQQHDAVLARLSAVDERLAGAPTVSTTRTMLQAEYRQLSAVRELDKLVPDRTVHMTARGWAASPDVLLTLLDQVARRAARGPVRVLECGSGLSTVYLAALVARSEHGGLVVALEHEPAYRDRTQLELDRLGLSHVAEVRLAPLREVRTPQGEDVQWYDTDALGSLDALDVVFIDGPPTDSGPCARYPVLPLVQDRLSSDAVLVLDDADRPEERKAVDRWTKEHGATAERLAYHEKGCVLVTTEQH